MRVSLENFIARAKEQHSDFYDYSLIKEIKTVKDKVSILCPNHGLFEQRVQHHLAGHGCDNCAHEFVRNAAIKKQDDFVKELREIHGDTYDYSRLKYTKSTGQILIGCKHHGFVSIQASNHRMGRKCPNCAKTGFKESLPAIFYILVYGNTTKVGITNKDLKIRISRLNKSSGKQFSVAFQFHSENGGEIAILEGKVLSFLRENFKPTIERHEGWTESFLDVGISTIIDFVLREVKLT